MPVVSSSTSYLQLELSHVSLVTQTKAISRSKKGHISGMWCSIYLMLILAMNLVPGLGLADLVWVEADNMDRSMA